MSEILEACPEWGSPGALAHLAVRGLGEVANGLLHPLVTPAHGMLLLALALLIGQQTPLDLKSPMRVFAPVSAMALALTTWGWLPAVWSPGLTLAVLVVAPWVAAEKALSRPGIAGACAMVAILLGMDSAVESGSPAATAKTLIGTWVGLNGVLAYAAVCVSHAAGRPRARIALRVIASWLIAIALLVLAFALRKG